MNVEFKIVENDFRMVAKGFAGIHHDQNCDKGRNVYDATGKCLPTKCCVLQLNQFLPRAEIRFYS